MRTSLDHLPPAKQRELERVVQILFEEFGDAIAIATSDWKKQACILKVILYGSYARGGWVDEPHTAKGYQSDFDLLVIVNNDKLTDRVEFWATAEDRLNRELAITKTLRTPVNFIVHTLQEVNDGLAHGRYFFMDVARDGIALYESEPGELHQPKPKTPPQALAMAREYFLSFIQQPRTSRKARTIWQGRGAISVRRFFSTKLRNSSITACCWFAPSTPRMFTTSDSCARKPNGLIRA
ncbi:putative nucleotidyltransferase [Sphingomonas trueperi]|uniref:Putative nucleotidyltransferase n=1 Tax=Sphingomonas trueperi TaxID=53317 RepID=A0A7X5Y347_9SPHN|nr:putative nucleotidyltransferase [Sphingomonas trueperi]